MPGPRRCTPRLLRLRPAGGTRDAALFDAAAGTAAPRAARVSALIEGGFVPAPGDWRSRSRDFGLCVERLLGFFGLGLNGLVFRHHFFRLHGISGGLICARELISEAPVGIHGEGRFEMRDGLGAFAQTDVSEAERCLGREQFRVEAGGFLEIRFGFVRLLQAEERFPDEEVQLGIVRFGGKEFLEDRKSLL